MKSKLVLQTGQEFTGLNFGCQETKIGELVFNTSMVGYQDVLSDPAYFGKIVCMSYPLIGNYGLADEDYDAKNIFVKGFVVREYNDSPSNFRSTRTLQDAMEDHHVVGISEIDTREIVRLIRDNGIVKAMICDDSKPLAECLKEIEEYQEETNILDVVSCKKVWYSRTTNPIYSIVVVDCGVKTTFVRQLNEDGFNVVVVPYNTSKDQILKYKPNGVIISNGPGNPSLHKEVVLLIKELQGNVPLLGVGLGALLIALANNVEVKKLKHGHQGANLPVRNIKTGKIEITSQNHFYSIVEASILKSDLEITHKQVIDEDIEGFINEESKVIGVLFNPQYNKENEEYLLKRFASLMSNKGE